MCSGIEFNFSLEVGTWMNEEKPKRLANPLELIARPAGQGTGSMGQTEE
jgi:hypothetical protein